MEKTTKWLLHLSGGLDSTFALWNFLNTTDEDIIIHHLNLRHKKEDRLHQERMAVMGVISYLNDNGYGGRISYYESSFDYGNLPKITVKDIQIVSLFTAIILKTPTMKSVENLILSWHKGEVHDVEIHKGFRVKKMLKALEVDRKINFHFPIAEFDRKYMMENLPADLLKAVHSCRKPTLDKRVCGKCKTCMEYIELGLNPT